MAESNFKRLERKLSHRKGVTDPAALAASIGDKKLGAHEMAERSAESRRKHRDAQLRKRRRHD